MCGLVSVIIKDNTKIMNKTMIEIFKQMLYADALRGWDSTGMALIKGNDDVSVIKEPCSAGPFLFRHQDHTWANQNRAIIGHNRWATKGSVTAENAHPFTEGKITLAHNGTLRYHKHLKNVDVDSHAICHSINEKGAVETLEKLEGAYALIWFDSETKQIHATRNLERPLWIVETDDLFILVSEKGLAHWICGRNGVPVRKTTECQAGTLYSFKESKANRIFFETTKYKMHKPFFQPMVPSTTPAGTQTGDKPLVTVPATNNVHQIRPMVEPAIHDVVVGDKLEVLCWKKQITVYNNFELGKVKWEADSLEYPDMTIEIYTNLDEDYEDHVIQVEVHRVFYSTHLKHTTLICKNPTLQKKPIADEEGPAITSNGVKLTDQVISQVKDSNCIFCSEPFQNLEEEQMSQIVLNPLHSNGHVYKYSYYCPNCADYFTLKKYKAMAKK